MSEIWFRLASKLAGYLSSMFAGLQPALTKTQVVEKKFSPHQSLALLAHCSLERVILVSTIARSSGHLGLLIRCKHRQNFSLSIWAVHIVGNFPYLRIGEIAYSTNSGHLDIATIVLKGPTI